MFRKRASLFTSTQSFSEESFGTPQPVAQQQQQQPPPPAAAPPPVDVTVDRAQVLVANYISDQVERTGQEPIVVAKKRPRAGEEGKDEDEQVVVPPFVLENAGVAKAIVDIAGRNPDVCTMADVGKRDNIEALFASRLQTNGRVVDELVASVPTPQECAAVINRLEDANAGAVGKWTKLYVGLAIDKNLEILRLESLTVSDVADFLRPADPLNSFERPCTPLIDSRTKLPRTCESIIMGSPQPLREFLLPTMVHGKRLPKFQRCCWLCMQRFVTVEWAKRHAKREQDVEDEDEWRIVLHDYDMVINRPGGFSDKLLIPIHGRACGIAGNILSHDTTMYIPKTFTDKQGRQTLVGWKFADAMLFRPGATKGQ
jgi:hypothetical protein